MNVSLRYESDFAAAIYYPGDAVPSLQLNSYSVKLHLITRSEDTAQINLAMDRVRAWIYDELAHTVFLSQAHTDTAASLTALGANITTLPEDPLDQIIGIMLYCKLNAIMCERMFVEQLELSSKLGDQVWYTHSDGDPVGPFAASGWWHEPNTSHSDMGSVARTGTVTKMRNAGWKKYDLEWPSGRAATDGSTVVFADFKHNET